MLKSFLIIISFSFILSASQQIILVVSPDFNSSKASLECLENGKTIFKPVEVNIGKNGLGWGLGFVNIRHSASEVQKIEGDKKAPIGIFKLSKLFGNEQNSHYKMPYMYTTDNLICVDDIDSKQYNKIIYINEKKPNSYEVMKRKDKQYELGIVVQHNRQQSRKRGSCIFIHVEKEKDHATVGCTSMPKNHLQKIANWLDKTKNPILIQIPKKYINEVVKLYPKLKNARLVQRGN